jgi:hypothetical protein
LGHASTVAESIVGQKKPAGHLVHADWPPVLNVPRAHCTGSATGVGHSNPAGHVRHAGDAAGLYVPLVHSTAEPDGVGHAEPAEHAVHVVAFAPLK